MNKIAFVHADIYTPDALVEDGAILVSNGRIEAVDRPENLGSLEAYSVIDATGQIIAPGFIDGQTHGGVGYDFMDAAPEQIAAILKWSASTGVTGLLPTVATTSLENQIGGVRNLCEVQKERPPGAAILGIHLEGPYICREKRGAQPENFIRDPSIPEIESVLQVAEGNVRLITLAPELDGALDFIRYITAQGVIASIGHSSATYEQVIRAADAGLSRATHLFNTMTGLNHRHPGAVGAALSRDDIYVEIILDGHHVHPAAAQVALRAKGVDRVVLVTDATQAAGLEDGVYIRPGNRKVVVKNRTVRLESGELAGSILTMDQAMRNATEMLALPLSEALALASRVPAESLGFGEYKGSLKPGKDADLVALSKDLQVLLTMVGGQVMHRSGRTNQPLPPFLEKLQ